jgi:GT2 family glycosyltransferase
MLAGCLISIAEGSIWPQCLVVVDQSASTKVADLLRSLSERGLATRYISSSQRGAAAATNRGLEQILTRYVAITHDDCLVEHDWLAQMTKFLQAKPDAILTGRVNPGGEGVVVSINTSPIPAKYTRPQLRGDVLFPNNMGFALAIFDEIGPFDERGFLQTAEDNDWCYRALRRGIPIQYEPSVSVSHLDWRDSNQLIATYRSYARSQGGVYGKYVRQGEWFMALRLFIALARAMRRWTTGFLQGNDDKVANGKAFLTELLPGFIAGWRAGTEG